jgi:hypothetical protein
MARIPGDPLDVLPLPPRELSDFEMAMLELRERGRREREEMRASRAAGIDLAVVDDRRGRR